MRPRIVRRLPVSVRPTAPDPSRPGSVKRLAAICFAPSHHLLPEKAMEFTW